MAGAGGRNPKRARRAASSAAVQGVLFSGCTPVYGYMCVLVFKVCSFGVVLFLTFRGTEPEVEARGQQDDDDGDAWEYELTPEEAARFGSLTTRCSARVLVKARKKFSRRQQGAVRALGFGKLLDLEVVQTPGRMGRWLLENFNPKTMSLRLGNGVSLPIQEDDVEATLGLPRGRVTITKRGNNDVSNFLLRWRGKFGTTSHEITPKMIALEMASLTDGCEWFKRHFTTLMVTTLIECMNNGYAYQMITDEFEEVEKIGELNWCKFLLDSLVETRAAWLKNPRQRYIGPILFLTVFYVDRVSFGARSVARSVPAISGWTRKLLCGREFAEIRGGGFGLGTVEPRLCDVVVDGALGGGNGGAGDGGEDAHSDGPNDADLRKPLIDRVIEKAKAAAMSIRELLQVLREASSPMLDVQADNLVQVLAASRLLLRFGPLTTGHSMPTQDPSQSLFTASQDAFWAEPVNLRALEEIERAVEERNAFQDMPSFSLGMTQELATQQWDDVVDVARQNDSGVGAGDVARGCPPCAPVAASPCNTPLQPTTVIQNVVREVIVRPGVGVIGEDVYPMVCDPQFVTPKEPILPRAEVLSSQLRAPALAAPFKMMRPQGGGGLVQGGTSLMSRYLPPTPEEHDFYSWIVDNRHAHVHEELFNYNGWAATRNDLLSLKIGSQLRVAVIDVWSCILNVRELSRTAGVPSRFFASIETTLNTVVCRSAPRARRLEWFSKSMEGGLKLSPYGEWRNINMFIFPILQNEHYYVISFDMVRKRIDIIDNISVTMTNVAKYGSIPEVLRDFVSVFLDDMVDERYGFAVRRITPRRMQMHWRDVNNKVDCGVFAMRHMETFLGQSVKSWDCGLRKGDRKGLESLRVSYMRQILAVELNVHHSKNIRCAVDFRDAVSQN